MEDYKSRFMSLSMFKIIFKCYQKFYIINKWIEGVIFTVKLQNLGNYTKIILNVIKTNSSKRLKLSVWGYICITALCQCRNWNHP
jgi:hypothetical protein